MIQINNQRRRGKLSTNDSTNLVFPFSRWKSTKSIEDSKVMLADSCVNYKTYVHGPFTTGTKSDCVTLYSCFCIGIFWAEWGFMCQCFMYKEFNIHLSLWSKLRRSDSTPSSSPTKKNENVTMRRPTDSELRPPSPFLESQSFSLGQLYFSSDLAYLVSLTPIRSPWRHYAVTSTTRMKKPWTFAQ